ncbi:MAG TPA: hypothetical protein VFI25_02090 [Planctomycetota bacterium]|jgi:hypothetical protein|nr:hypothetical protein [Planctomycetota bacterium]
MEERERQGEGYDPVPGAGLDPAPFREYLRIQRRARTVGGLVAVGALAIVVGCVGLCYRTVRSNFSEDRVRRAASEEAEQLLPTLREQGVALLREVQPTYVAEGKRALRGAMPELGKRLEHELLGLAANLSRRTDEALGAAFVSAAEETRRELRAAFPDLHEKALEERLAGFESRLREETERFLAETTRVSGPAQERFVATLARFPRLKELSDEELQRRFLHLWLLLVDLELTGGMTDPAMDAPPAAGPRRG